MGKVSKPALAVVGLVCLGLVLLFWPSAPSDQTSQSASRETASITSGGPTSAPSPHTDGTPGHDHSHAVDPAQRHTVVRFARAFGRPSDRGEWLSALRPLVTPALLEGFRLTDPRRRPSLGAVRRVTALAEAEGVFTVTYASGDRVAVTLVAEGPGWLVEGVEPVREPDPTGTDV